MLSECPVDTWGEQCENTCTCNMTNTMECSKATGCTCNQFWTGANCTEDIDECTTDTHDCPANSECSDKDGGFDCVCNQGYLTDNHENCAGECKYFGAYSNSGICTQSIHHVNVFNTFNAKDLDHFANIVNSAYLDWIADQSILDLHSSVILYDS